MQGQRKSLHIQLAIKSALLVGLLSFLVSSAHVFHELKNEKEHFQEFFDNVYKSTLKSATEATYTQDSKYAQTIVNGLLKFDFFSYIEILDDRKQLLAGAGEPSKKSERGWILCYIVNDQHVRTVPLVRESTGETVGAIRFSIDARRITEHFIDHAGLIFVIGFILCVLMMFALVILFYFVISRPLMMTIREISKMDSSSDFKSESAGAVLANRNDELGELVVLFNRLLAGQYEMRDVAIKSKYTLQSIMDHAPAVIYVKDPDGRYIFVNKRFEILFRNKGEELIGKTDHDVFPEEIADKFQKNDKEVLFSGCAQESEEIAPQDDGLHTYHSIKFPLCTEDGEIYAICGISTDVTEKKQQEEQLRHSQKMNALGKLTGGVAHDYNNMLAVVMGFAELLQSALSDQPKLAKYAEAIYHAGDRGSKMTKKLLAFGRKSSVSAEKVVINTLLKDMQTVLQKTLTPRIKLIFEPAKDLWPMLVDYSELETTVFNLCINAMQAIKNNGQITIRTSNEKINQVDTTLLVLEPGDYVLLSITDTGCGMDKETKDKLFEPFFTTKEEMGIGLGLSQVYGFVYSSGGAIMVYSEPGHGARFALYFPRYNETPGKQPLLEEKNEIDSKANAADITGTETILLVDDEPSLLILGREILEKHGFNVISAESAKLALDILEHETVDILIADIVMPDMDGYQLAAMVKEKYPAIKIQLVSGFSGNIDMSMTDESVRKNLLPKPYSEVALLQRIRDLLNDD